MPTTGSSSLPRRLQAEWVHRWAPHALQLPDGRIAAAGDWLTTVRSTIGAPQDTLLRLLLEAADDGERAAERLLWVLLIPPVDRAAPASLEDGWSRRDRPGIVAAAVWETIRCSATDAARPHVFRHLVRDATTLLTREMSAGRRRLDRATLAVDPVLLADLAGAAPARVAPAEVRLARLLAAAVHAGVATGDEVGLLHRTLLEDRTVAQVATELDVTPAALRRRLQRLTRRLGDYARTVE